MAALRFTILASTLTAALAYTWPNPALDTLEGLRWDQLGYSSFDGALFVTPCDRFIHPTEKGSKGVRSNAGDWLRTAYHDMATHNVEDGTGGLDASIRFWEEQARSENAGDHFNNSLGFIGGAMNRHFTMSDGLALLAVFAVENCGGPEIAYRGGRLDATKPNSAGVPEPDQSIESHTAAFKRQGFTPKEMIGLVACGHTFGSVQHRDFKDVVPASPDGEDVTAGVAFDGSLTNFDNSVAVEYINGTTKNPLVVGLNATKNSDARIFSSDGNQTMSAFAQDLGHFHATCADLLARMIDTVPKEVTLTEVIRPLPAKPVELRLTYSKDGNITLSGDVRLFNTTENAKRTVAIAWEGAGSDEAVGTVSRAAMPHDAKMAGSAQASKITSLWYGNRTRLAAVAPATGFGRFWFEVNEGAGAGPVKMDQDGAGFRLPVDHMVMVAEGTCEANVRVAVHKDAHVDRVFLELDTMQEDNFSVAREPATVNVTAPADATPDANGYTIYTAKLDGELQWSVGYGIVAEVAGERRELPQNMRNDFCP